MKLTPVPAPGQNPSATPGLVSGGNISSAIERAKAIFNNKVPTQESAPIANIEPPKEIVQADTVAEVTPKASEPVKEDDQLSSHYANLARKEKALRSKVQAREAELLAKEQAIAAREEAIKLKDLEYQSKYIPRDRVQQDPFSVMAELGINSEDLINRALSQPQQDPYTKAAMQRLEDQIKKLEEAQVASQKGYEEQQTQAYQQAVAQIRSDAKQLVDSNPEYEATKALGAHGEIAKLIEMTWKEDGILLTLESAAQAVEKAALEKVTKYSAISKLQSRQKPAESKPVESEAPVASQQQQQGLKTLTNAVGTTRPLTARERAVLAFEGKLK